MSLLLAALLISLCAIAFLCIPAERARLWRGFLALHSVMGTQFLFACGLVLALLAAALLRHQGPFALTMALLAFLVCIRAHDLGELPDDGTAKRSELDADYDPLQHQREVVGGFTPQSSAEFERNRFAVAHGQPHPSAEL